MNTEPVDSCFYCTTCSSPFKAPLYSVSRSLEDVDHVELQQGMPVVHIDCAEGIGTFCSETCRDRGMAAVLKEDNVVLPSESPWIGPEETCARCSGPVDMTKPHWTYTSDVTTDDGNGWTTTDFRYLAVLCTTCQAPNAILRSFGETAGKLALPTEVTS